MARLIDLLDSNFDPDSVEASRSMDPIPDGDYVMQITKTELAMNKAGTGHRLDVEFTIIEGQYTDRKVFLTLNVVHPNKMAQGIAMRDLKAISEACGVDFNMALEDSDNLLFQPFRGHVVYAQDMMKNALGVKEPKRNPETGMPYPARNRVASFHSLFDQEPAPAPVQTAPAPRAAAPAARPAAAAPAARAAVAGQSNPFGKRA
jgi:hypothetical protein